MRVQAECSLEFDVAEPTPLILMLRPCSGAAQRIDQERYTYQPWVPVREYIDSYGNFCHRLEAPPGLFSIAASVEAEVSDTIDVAPGAPWTPIPALPDDALRYLLPSRYCPSDLMADIAMEAVGDAAPGWDQAEAIRAWIHAHIRYEYGASNASTWALDTMSTRTGVCRDFAHLGIALCRNRDIPARMVTGYLHGLTPMDLHAWFEAFVGGRWYTFDATQDRPRGGRLVVAYGRDATDVALTTQFGPAPLTGMQVWVNG